VHNEVNCALHVIAFLFISLGDEEPRSLASCVWREDVALALDGCQSCWSYGVLHTMSGLHLLDSNWRQQPLEWVLQQRWQESAVQAALAALFRDKWQGLTEGNPRTAPSAGIHKLTHHAWVTSLTPALTPFLGIMQPHTCVVLVFQCGAKFGTVARWLCTP
jgi:hypothetical protein